MPPPPSSPRATIAILSIGQMGYGIATLLLSQNYRVITNLTSRSSSTQARAASANIELVPDDTTLVNEADYILSIVPPRDAVATAQRIIDVYAQAAAGETSTEPDTKVRKSKPEPLWYLDLNAIAPSTTRHISSLLSQTTPKISFLDGGIIGAPPSLKPSLAPADPTNWTRPSIPLSGPLLSTHPVSGAHLADALNTRHLNDAVGTASALKCSFAALSKGFTALALQSYSTAQAVGILPHLQFYLDAYNPGAKAKAERGVTGCPDKAYRWVEEMRQIGRCFEEEGGWGPRASVFEGVAGVYEDLAQLVETRGGSQGMTDKDDVESAVEILRKGLKDGTVSKEALNEMLLK